jgi:phosphoribosylformylglycinamidine cyclo-ligase
MSNSQPNSPSVPGDLYKQAGVDIDAGNAAVARMKPAIRATFTPNVLADVGSFGGLFALDKLPAAPVLVASTDGVGTKVKLAAQVGRWRSVGHDIVNHCVNDILVQNARPLFFLDYVASSKLDPVQTAEVVIGIAEACQAAGCALLGGETAEMPGVYAPGAFDLVGTVIGLVDRGSLLPRPEAMQPGDVLLGLPSSGPHTNGYSLIRRVIEEHDLQEEVGGVPLVEALLAPHRCYLPEVNTLQAAQVPLLGMAHITGGGFLDNVPRILPDTLQAQIDPASWPVPPLFAKLVEWGGVPQHEAYRVWNMGVGMVLVVPAAAAAAAQARLPEAMLIGWLSARPEGGSGGVLVESLG